jgi:PQQ-dependent catabolism-associated beta-propeller protein
MSIGDPPALRKYGATGEEPIMASKPPTRGRNGSWLAFAGALVGAVVATSPAGAERTGLVIVSNEKSNTLTILDRSHAVIKTVPTCGRPRGMKFSANRQQFYVGCGDDNTIAIYDLATLRLVKRYRDIADPETFDLHPNGRDLYISNEDDSEATVLDVETGEIKARYETGAEPEGVLITPDGRLAFVASEAANLVHVIDIAARKIVKNILVGTRPRRFALRPDGKELWVSAELSGEINIIDLARLEVAASIVFAPPAIRRDQVTPVDVLITRDGKRAYVALGRANRVAVVDVATRTVNDFVLVGKRPWGLQLTGDEKTLYVANGLSDDVSIVETATGRVIKSVPVGIIPYGILIDD